MTSPYATRKGTPEEAIAKMDERMQERRIDSPENLPYSNDKVKQSIDRAAYSNRVAARGEEAKDYLRKRGKWKD